MLREREQQMTAAPFRYARIGYVALNVTDLERSVAFYEDVVGLERVSAMRTDCAFFRCSRDHHNIVLIQSGEPGLKRIGWQLESEADVERAFDHFDRQGLRPERLAPAKAAEWGEVNAFRVREPTTRTTFEYYDAMMVMATPFRQRLTKIARLGHVVLRSADHRRTVEALTETFNFRISDVWGERTTFMRCFPNPYHHSLGIVNSEVSQLHHVNFMVTDLADIGQALNRLKRANVSIVFGPGHHPPSDSVFLYFLDPDGLTLEYSFGMEEFDEFHPRSPRWLSPGFDSIDDWGGEIRPGYGAVGAIDVSDEGTP